MEAGRDQFLDAGNRLFASKGLRMTRNVADANLHCDWHIRREGRSNSPYHLDGKALAPFRIAAPLIIAHVGQRGPELADQVAIGRVNMDAIKICPCSSSCRLVVTSQGFFNFTP